MKQFLTLSLALSALVSLQAADTIFRIDLSALKDKVVLTTEKDDDLKASTFSWVKAEEKPYTQSISFLKKVPSTEWKDYDFTFIPSQSGTVNVSIGGQWAKTPEERQWLLVNEVKLNDTLYPNGDFKKTWTNKKDGRVIPNGFWIAGKAKYLPTAGEKGTPAVLVNHDNRLSFNMKVAAGKKYELEFEVKAASPAEFK